MLLYDRPDDSGPRSHPTVLQQWNIVGGAIALGMMAAMAMGVSALFFIQALRERNWAGYAQGDYASLPVGGMGSQLLPFAITVIFWVTARIFLQRALAPGARRIANVAIAVSALLMWVFFPNLI